MKSVTATSSRPSAYYSSRSNLNNQSRLEKIHAEAKSMLAQKAAEITELNGVIEKAEEQLKAVKAELMAKSTEMAQYQDDDEDENNNNFHEQQIIEKVREEQEIELRQILAKNEKELNQMKLDYQKSLQEAEDWATRHAKSVASEKSAQLDQLRKEVEQMKAAQADAKFAAQQSRTKMYQQSKDVTFQNSQRIQYLEAQLSEIVSITREEMRDIRAKIEESLAAIEIRRKEHANEIAKYEHELSEREIRYNEHWQALQEQHAAEKQRVEQSVAESGKKTENLQKILKQLEKQHTQQLETTLKDIETMKHSIYKSRTKNEEQMAETKTYIAQTQSIHRECKQIEQEIAIIENELQELNAENQDLRMEIAQLDKNVYTNPRA